MQPILKSKVSDSQKHDPRNMVIQPTQNNVGVLDEREIKLFQDLESSQTISRLFEEQISQQEISLINEFKKKTVNDLPEYLKRQKEQFSGLKPLVKMEIVRLCLKKNPMYTAYFFPNFQIKCPLMRAQLIEMIFKKMSLGQLEKFLDFAVKNNLRFSSNGIEDRLFVCRVAKQCAEKGLIHDIENLFAYFEIQAKEKREIADAYIEYNPLYLLRRCYEFEIYEEEFLLDIADSCLVLGESNAIPYFLKLPEALQLFFNQFSEQRIFDELDFHITVEFVLFVGKKDLKTTIENLREIFLDGRFLTEEERFSLAQKWMKHDPSLIAEKFSCFQIESQSKVLELAKSWAATEQRGGKCFFSHFGIKNPLETFDIAKIYAKNNPERMLRAFDQFGLEKDQEVKIIQLSALKDPWGAWHAINRRGITDLSIALKIAVNAVKWCPTRVHELLCLFYKTKTKIPDDPQFKTEVLCLFVEHMSNEFFSWIVPIEGWKRFCQDFNISSEDQYFRLLKSYFKRTGGCNAKNLEAFGVKQGSTEAVELALASAEGNGVICAKNIEFFGVTSPEVLFAIIERALKNNPMTARYLSDFGVQDPLQKKALATRCAEWHSEGILPVLEEFEIEQEEDRCEIACICARLSPDQIAKNLDFFKLNKPESALKVIRASMEENPETLLDYISISPETIATLKLRNEIFNIAVREIPYEFIDFIVKSGRESLRISREDLFHLIEMSLYSTGGEAAAYICLFDLAEEQENHLVYKALKMNLDLLEVITFFKRYRQQVGGLTYLGQAATAIAKEQRELCVGFLQKFLCSVDGFSHWNGMLTSIGNVQDSFESTQKLWWFTCALFGMYHYIEEHHRIWIAQEGFLEFFVDFHLPEQRHSLTFALLECKTKKFFLLYQNLQAFDFEKGLGKMNAKLLRSAFCRLIELDLEAETPLQIIQYLRNKKFFNDAKKCLVFVETLFLLVEKCGDKPLCIKAIFERLYTKRSEACLRDEIFALNLLLKYHYEMHLKQEKFDFKNFGELLGDLFCQGFSLNGNLVRDQIKEKFLLSRSEQSVFFYGFRMMCSAEREVHRCFKTIVQSVLNDTFSEMRNSLEGNPHLQKVFGGDYVSLREKWMTPLPTQEFDGFCIVETEDFHDLLLSGTEVPRSCMSIHSRVRTGRGLLGILRDGRTRMFAMKDKSGQVHYRAFAKILWGNKTPVLFLETIYGKKDSKEHELKIYEMVKQKALFLGIPLLARMSSKRRNYGAPVVSLEGPAPYDNLDALIAEGATCGLIKKGQGVLKQATIID